MAAWSAREFFGKLAALRPAWTKPKTATASKAAAPPLPPQISRLYALVPTPESSWVVEFDYIMYGRELGLAVVFKSGVRCFYAGTTYDQYYTFRHAPSKGRWVHENIYHLPYVII